MESSGLGNCPLCGRKLISGPSINIHHLIPKLKGGSNGPKAWMHKICHSKLHSIWSEWELANHYHEWDIIKADERIKRFIKWISKKDPEFMDSNKMARQHRKRRRK